MNTVFYDKLWTQILDAKKHVNKIANKCYKTTGVLNKLNHVLPLDIKTLVYNSQILSHINYCITVWGYKGSRILRIQKRQFE